MIDDLGRQSRKLEQWKKQWLFCDETPDSLHLHFWGEAEFSTVKIKVETMRAHYAEGKRELRHFANLTETHWNAIESARRIWLKRVFIWTKKKYLQELLEKMAKTLRDLDDAAKDGWCRHQQYKKKDVDFADVHHLGIGHLIVPIAMQTRNYTDTLWQCCHFARESFTTELDLDIFGASSVNSRDEYSETVTKAAADKHAILTILTRGASLRMAEMTRVCFKQSAASTRDNVPALVDALTRVTNGSEECHFTAGSNLTFNVFKSSRQHCSPGTGMRKSFREIQSKNSSPHFANEDLLGSISKFRIAFELAQACLLFLRTTWFSEICTCGIRCGRPSGGSDELTYDFTLQLGEVMHQPAQWAGTRIQVCWEHMQHNWNVLTRPIRRLGLLLIEVTLGTTVLETESDANGAFTFVTFVKGESGNLRRMAYSIEYVLEKVRLAARKSDAYKNAVNYCVKKQFPQTPDDEQMKNLLAEIYWEVVVP